MSQQARESSLQADSFGSWSVGQFTVLLKEL